MKQDIDFDYSMQPGLKLLHQENYHFKNPLVSIITPYYNSKAFFEQTANSVFNQTFPFWEWIIVNDGSDESDTISFIKKITNNDKRVKIIDSENKGPSSARMLGANAAKTEFIFFLDADDLINETMIESCYWCLETTKKASWAYANAIGFGDEEYLWNVPFDSKIEKRENILLLTAMIRKEVLIKSGGFETTIKDFHEDWQLWLKLLSMKYVPAQINFYGFWYRRRNSRKHLIDHDMRLKKISANAIKKYARRIKGQIDGFVYPNVEIEKFELKYFKWDDKLKIKEDHSTILILADSINIKMFNNPAYKDKSKILITTKEINHRVKQLLEEQAVVFDLSSFLTIDNWIGFIDYIIKSRNINNVFCENKSYFASIMPFVIERYPTMKIKEIAGKNYISLTNDEDKLGNYVKYIKKNSNINKKSVFKQFLYRFGRKMWKYKFYRFLILFLKKSRRLLTYERKK